MLDKLENGKEKVIGKIKETSGKVTNDEGLAFAGKLQSIIADFGNATEKIKVEALSNTDYFIESMQDSKEYEE